MVTHFDCSPLQLGVLEMSPERLVGDLGNGQVVEVCLVPDRLDPVAPDVEGG
jgi:hypothetical protein